MTRLPTTTLRNSAKSTPPPEFVSACQKQSFEPHSLLHTHTHTHRHTHTHTHTHTHRNSSHPSCRRKKREIPNRLRALRATRPHTVRYIGECDQEQGEIESLCIRLPKKIRASGRLVNFSEADHSRREKVAIYMVIEKRVCLNDDFVLVTGVVWSGPPIIMGGRDTSP